MKSLTEGAAEVKQVRPGLCRDPIAKDGPCGFVEVPSPLNIFPHWKRRKTVKILKHV